MIGYIGSKSYAVRQLARYVPRDIEVIGSPFFGMGHLELFLGRSRGVRVVAGDLFWPVVLFWRCVLNERAALIEEIYRLRSVTWDQVKEFSRDLTARETVLSGPADVAKFIVALRTERICCPSQLGGYGSWALAMPREVSAWNGGLWKHIIKKIRRWRVPPGGFSIEHIDAFDFFDKYPGMFLYCDPPYWGKNYYGFKGELGKDFDHVRLSDTLRGRAGWILSYGECPEVRELYRGMLINKHTWQLGSVAQHGVQDRRGLELLIQSPGSPSLAELGRREIAARRAAVSEKVDSWNLKVDFFL